MSYRDRVTVQELQRRFSYDNSGCLIRKVITHTTSYPGEKIWGHSTGTREGYRRLYIGHADKIPFHAAVFAVVHGRWPRGMIDHIDRNSKNNRIENLREATRSQNRFNEKLNSRNKTGYRGIYWSESRKSFRVILGVKGKYKFLGCFKNKRDAVKAQREGILRYHKEFRAI